MRISARSAPADGWRRCALLFAICDAQLRCVARRCAGAFAASPLLVVLALAAFAALPVAAAWAGRRSAPALSAADPTLVAVSACALAAFAGAGVALLVGDASLGRQLAAAPVPSAVRVAALHVFPAAVAVVAAAPSYVAFAWPAAGVRAVPIGLELLAVAGIAGVAVRVVAACARREARPAVRRSVRGLFASACARYARRRELRRQVVAGALLAVGATVALRATGAGPAAALFGAFCAVVASAVVPLAAPGLDRRAEWLWRAAPRSRARLAATFAGAALACGVAASVLAAAAAVAVAPVAPARLAPLLAALALAAPCALLAGALVPWRAERAGEQLASYALLALLATLVWALLARIAPHGLEAVALVAASAVTLTAAAVQVQK